MKTRHLIKQLDRQLVEAGIRSAEQATSGEIRVIVHHKPVEDAVAAASAAFLRLGMDKTRERNAVLIFVAPESQKFAVIGDEAVHQKCGDIFWQELAAAMTGHFKQARFTDGLRLGISRAGALLAEHFPRQAGDVDELPNEVIEE
jgi:uncharacterized membrane protein